jgi:hypothetical protein
LRRLSHLNVPSAPNCRLIEWPTEMASPGSHAFAATGFGAGRRPREADLDTLRGEPVVTAAFGLLLAPLAARGPLGLRCEET